jgi:hypothetical protein
MGELYIIENHNVKLLFSRMIAGGMTNKEVKEYQ